MTPSQLHRCLIVTALAASACTPAPAPVSPLAAVPQRVVIDGVGIAFHVFGTGPVVFAHPGGPGVEWSYLRMPGLEQRATVVYLEPFGTGNSGNLEDPDGYTIDNYVKVIDAVRSYLGVNRIVLLGHSHGGFVAQAYALAHPDHLRGLILYDTSPSTGPEWQQDVEANLKWFAREPWFAEASAALAAETSAKTDAEATAVFRRELPLYFADWTGRSREFEPLRSQVRVSVAPGKSGSDPSSPAEVGVAPPFDVRSRLHEIATPTLILVGTKDFVCSAKMAAVLHDGIPGSRLVTLAHSGHMGHVEQPRELVGAIGDFLAGLPPEAK
jgi:proline iminopeptidase